MKTVPKTGKSWGEQKWFKIAIFLGILGLLTWSVFLRFYHIGAQPYWMDEGYTINAVLSINEHGNTVLDSGQNYHCPLFCYGEAYLANKLDHTAFGYRLLPAIAGVLLILILFLYARTFFNIYIALIASFLISFSYYEIAWSRQARWYSLFAFFTWLALYFFKRACEGTSRTSPSFLIFISLTVIFTCLSILTFNVGLLLPIFMIIWLVYKKGSWKWTLAGFVLLAPLSYFMALTFGFSFHYVLPYYLSFYLRSYWIWIAFALLAIFNSGVSTRIREEVYFLLLLILVFVIPFSFFTNVVQYRYLFAIVPAIFLLGSIGMYEILLKIKNKWLKALFIIAVFAIFFFTKEGVLKPQTNYFLESDDPTKDYGAIDQRSAYLFTPQPDWNSAYDFIKNNSTSTDVTISSLPQFNKIFLNRPGYWIYYSYTGNDHNDTKIINNKEYYVGAEVINNLSELQNLASTTHGFIIFDYFALGRMDTSITSYIKSTFPLVYHEQTNNYSEIWIYRF